MEILKGRLSGVGVVEHGKQFLRQHSALSVTFENCCLTMTCRNTESCSNPAAIQWWQKRRSVQHHETKSSGAVARTVDENFKPGLSLSLECRASSTSRVYVHIIVRTMTPDSQGRKPDGKFGGGDDDRLLSGPNFLLAKQAVLKHLTQ